MTIRAQELWYGRDLQAWLAARGAANDGPLSRARAALFETCRRLQGQVAAAKIAPEVTGVVIGLWRSGTTALHELLAEVPGLDAPRTAACFRPASFRLLPPVRNGRMQRPMDRLVVTPASPQEDEFALLLLGAPSPYRAFLSPMHLRDAFDEAVADAGQRAVPILREFLSVLETQDRHGIVLKSPPHLFRIGHILATWPRARAIYLARDPAEMFWSNMRMWTNMISHYRGLVFPRDQLEAFVARVFAVAAQSLHELCRRLDDRLLLVEYEALATDPVASVERILGALDLRPENPDDVRSRLAAAARRLATVPERTRDPVPQAAAAACDDLASAHDMLRRLLA